MFFSVKAWCFYFFKHLANQPPSLEVKSLRCFLNSSQYLFFKSPHKNFSILVNSIVLDLHFVDKDHHLSNLLYLPVAVLIVNDLCFYLC